LESLTAFNVKTLDEIDEFVIYKEGEREGEYFFVEDFSSYLKVETSAIKGISSVINYNRKFVSVILKK